LPPESFVDIKNSDGFDRTATDLGPGPVTPIVPIVPVESITHAVADIPQIWDVKFRAIIPRVRLTWERSSLDTIVTTYPTVLNNARYTSVLSCREKRVRTVSGRNRKSGVWRNEEIATAQRFFLPPQFNLTCVECFDCTIQVK
jgi:hypothetical protein